jgi:hypothetical protein
VLIAMPPLARRIGVELASQDGLATADSAAPVPVPAADASSP